jgi:hypothetical protein
MEWELVRAQFSCSCDTVTIEDEFVCLGVKSRGERKSIEAGDVAYFEVKSIVDAEGRSFTSRGLHL